MIRGLPTGLPIQAYTNNPTSLFERVSLVISSSDHLANNTSRDAIQCFLHALLAMNFVFCSNEYSALSYACRFSPPVAQALLDMHPEFEIGLYMRYSGFTPLHQCVLSDNDNRLSLFARLLDLYESHDLRLLNRYDETPSILRLLIEQMMFDTSTRSTSISMALWITDLTDRCLDGGGIRFCEVESTAARPGKETPLQLLKDIMVQMWWKKRNPNNDLDLIQFKQFCSCFANKITRIQKIFRCLSSDVKRCNESPHVFCYGLVSSCVAIFIESVRITHYTIFELHI